MSNMRATITARGIFSGLLLQLIRSRIDITYIRLDDGRGGTATAKITNRSEGANSNE